MLPVILLDLSIYFNLRTFEAPPDTAFFYFKLFLGIAIILIPPFVIKRLFAKKSKQFRLALIPKNIRAQSKEKKLNIKKLQNSQIRKINYKAIMISFILYIVILISLVIMHVYIFYILNVDYNSIQKNILKFLEEHTYYQSLLFHILSWITVIIANLVAGYIVVYITKHSEIKHAVFLGILILITHIGVSLFFSIKILRWDTFIFYITPIPSVVLGGYLRKFQNTYNEFVTKTKKNELEVSWYRVVIVWWIHQWRYSLSYSFVYFYLIINVNMLHSTLIQSIFLNFTYAFVISLGADIFIWKYILGKEFGHFKVILQETPQLPTKPEVS
jgi:hypothetical protein